MNKLDQLCTIRKTFKAMLKAYTPFEGKNLNRYKTNSLCAIEGLRSIIENTPFEMGGLWGCVAIDHKKVSLVDLQNKIVGIEKAIHELDLFESSYLEQAVCLQSEISASLSKLRGIKNQFQALPSYYIDDIIKTTIKGRA